jgi:hypothetical protein
VPCIGAYHAECALPQRIPIGLSAAAAFKMPRCPQVAQLVHSKQGWQVQTGYATCASIQPCFLLCRQAKGAADKAAGAAKDVSGSGAGPLQGAAGDAKQALGNLKQVASGCQFFTRASSPGPISTRRCRRWLCNSAASAYVLCTQGPKHAQHLLRVRTNHDLPRP